MLVRFLRRAWPWLVGLAIITAIAVRLPTEAFRAAIGSGPHLALAAVDLAMIVAALAADTFATWIALVICGARWTLRHTLAVRGATYLLSVVNYAVGQSGVGYYLHRGGVSTARAAAITLFTIGTTFATLLVVTLATWTFGERGPYAAMWWILVGAGAAFAVYLAIVAMRPAALARRALLAPLFETGLRGHAIAMAARLPHVVLTVLTHWFAMLAWGIHVPAGVALAVMPAVVIAGALPISPSGLGTIQGALVFFFSDYADGPTSEARAATVLAFAIVHFVYTTVGQLAVGVACLPFARTVAPAQR